MKAFDQIRRIACVGEVMIELTPAGADLARIGVAGDTYNTAVYLARLFGGGRTVSFVTALGRDAFSARILAHMAAHGLDASHVERRDDKAPGLYAIATDASGERSFAYWRSDSAARTLFRQPALVKLETLLGFDLVYLSGITLAILPPETRTALMATLDAFRAGGGIVAYDSNHRPRLWASVEEARRVNAEMWARTDIAFPSLDDEMALHGDADAAAVIARLAGLGVRFGALKRGTAGPTPLDGAPLDISFPPAPRVVDTTAAGDSFNAGALAALAEGRSLAEALAAGHALAARVVQAPGAILPADAPLA